MKENWRKVQRITEIKNQDALAASSGQKFKSFSSKKNNSKCNNYYQRGHWIKLCKKWIADGRSHKPSHSNTSKGNNTAVNVTLLFVDDEIFSAKISTDDLFIDNGASKHLTNNNCCFISFQSFEILIASQWQMEEA